MSSRCLRQTSRSLRCATGAETPGKRARGGDDAGGGLGEESAAARRPALGKRDAGTVRDAGVEQSVRRDEAFELAGNAGDDRRIGDEQPRARRAAQARAGPSRGRSRTPPGCASRRSHPARCTRVGGGSPAASQTASQRLHGGGALGECGRISESLRAPGQPLQIIAGNFRVDIRRRSGRRDTACHAAGMGAGAQLRRPGQQPIRDRAIVALDRRRQAGGEGDAHGRRARAPTFGVLMPRSRRPATLRARRRFAQRLAPSPNGAW